MPKQQSHEVDASSRRHRRRPTPRKPRRSWLGDLFESLVDVVAGLFVR